MLICKDKAHTAACPIVVSASCDVFVAEPFAVYQMPDGAYFNDTRTSNVSDRFCHALLQASNAQCTSKLAVMA